MKTWDEVFDHLRITPSDAAFWRRLNRHIERERQAARIREQRKKIVMGFIAWNSNLLEGAGWDCWELHRDALLEAYDLGLNRQPFTMYHFLKWHRAILPFGGTLRQSMPVSTGMGESFQPVPVAALAPLINQFVAGWIEQLDDTRPLYSLAALHFDQWRIHPFADGNKRHCRLLTTFGCGWFGLDPVCITLRDKSIYLDALTNADLGNLAWLFKACQVPL